MAEDKLRHNNDDMNTILYVAIEASIAKIGYCSDYLAMQFYQYASYTLSPLYNYGCKCQPYSKLVTDLVSRCPSS